MPDPTNPGNHRFTDDEITLILDRAAQLQRDQRDDAPASAMSLAEVTQVASEAGFDPALVQHAAADLDARSTDSASVRAAHTEHELCVECTVEGELSVDDHETAALEVEDAIRLRGSAVTLGRTLRWQCAAVADDNGPVSPAMSITLAPLNGRTAIRITRRVDERWTHALSAGLGLGLTAPIMVWGLDGPPWLMVLSPFLIGIPVYQAIRTTQLNKLRSYDVALRALLARLSAYVTRIADSTYHARVMAGGGAARVIPSDARPLRLTDLASARASSTGQRFTSEDLARILARAAELQQDGFGDDADGMSLEQLERVAREAGLDPSLVRRALEGLNTKVVAGTAPSTGAGTLLWLERTYDREIAPGEYDALVREFDHAVGRPGSPTTLGHSLRWTSRAGGRSALTAGPLSIVVTPRTGRTIFRVEENLSLLRQTAMGLGTLSGSLVFLTMQEIGAGSLLSRTTWAVAVSATGTLAAHLYCRVIDKQRRNALKTLMPRLAGYVAAAVARALDTPRTVETRPRTTPTSLAITSE